VQQADLFKEYRRLLKEDHEQQALSLLTEALRRDQLDDAGVVRAGEILRKQWTLRDMSNDALRVFLAGQCTTSWLAPALVGAAAARGMSISVDEGEYDQVLQGLESLDDRVDAVVLLPWHQRVLGGGAERSAEERIDSELALWQHAWKLAASKGARVTQVGYDWMQSGVPGLHLGGGGDGDIAILRRLNERLRQQIPPRSYFVDLDQISGYHGRDAFYDPRQYCWTRQPFSNAGLVRLAQIIVAGLRAVIFGPKKVVAVDLDNTLWGGVVGETGPLNIEIGDSPAGQAFRAFQQHLKDLSRHGCLLAVCSKNNPTDAREPFEQNSDMVLSLDDFAAFEAGWDPKTVMLDRIAQQLRLGLDSFVFVDDNPAEREAIRQALPQVEVVDLPEEPAEFVRALQAGGWFESVELTDEDRSRSRQYVAEQQRSSAMAAFNSIDGYLESLEMVADCRPLAEVDLDRVVQLIGKTNQFNLTTRRHSIDDVRAMLAMPNAIALILRLRDRFGDYGLISVLIGVPDPDDQPSTLLIDTWLMSCRAIGRTVEQFQFNELVAAARQQGYERLVGKYIPTPKNVPVRDLYRKLGFTCRDERDDGSATYDLSLMNAPEALSFVRSAAASG
jgi:FkbH-like protein